MATCADKTVFYQKLDALKTSSKGKDNKTTLFISDDFYYQTKFWLGQEEGSFKSMSKKDIATSKQKRGPARVNSDKRHDPKSSDRA